MIKNKVEEKIIINKSKTYLLPLISEVVKLPKDIINKSLINTYLDDSLNKYNNCIYLYFNYDIKNKNYTHFENELFENDYFVNSYDIGNKVLYIFRFPEEYMEEYNAYKAGKYSNFQIDAKILILKFLSKTLGNSQKTIPFIKKVKQILYKDERLKKKLETELGVSISNEQELGEEYKSNNETFNLNEYKD